MCMCVNRRGVFCHCRMRFVIVFVVLLRADLGYGEVGVFPADSPHGRIATPNLDKLASESMVFNQAYTGEAVCAPSRYSTE